MRLAKILLLATALTPALARAGDLTLKRVMLSTGGVGYIEYAADITGPATVGLDIPLAQVDDFLKSVVAIDSAGGVAGLELPGRDTTNAAFGDVPFGPDAFNDPLAYLNALRGTEFQVTGPRPMTGRLLSATKVHEPGRTPTDPGTDRTRITLLSTDGIRQFTLEDADTVQVSDPALRDRIAAALASLRRDASQSMRHVTLRDTPTNPADTAPRTLRVGYVAGMALWKTSYRLVLPATDGQKARLQGWAVVENATGADWNGVELTLQYGNPVTFRQALYRTYFVQRPEVPVEILGRILPAVDTSRAIAMAQPAPPPPVPAGAAMRGAARAPAPMAAKSALEDIAAPAEETATTEGAEETIFTLPTPVVLPAGHTASVPILDREVPAERFALVQPGRAHPLATIKLTNATGTSLPAGVLTLYDPTSAAAFAGDARLAGLSVGETRLLSFAEDLRTSVNWQTTDTTTIAALSAGAGTLTVSQRERATSKIDLAAPPAEPRNLLIEIPKRADSTITIEDNLKPTEETPTAWRVVLPLAAGEKRTIVAHVDHLVREQTQLTDNADIVLALLNTKGLDQTAHTALQHIADLRAAEAARTAERDRLTAQREQIESGEARIRENLVAVPAADALHGKLVRQLEAAEQRIDALNVSISQANDSVDAAHKALMQGVQGLKL